MNNRIKENIKVELNLKEIVWALLAQWKAFIALPLLMALIMTGVKFISDNQSYKAELAERIEAEKQSEKPVEERIADILKTVPEEDRDKVNFIVKEKEWLNTQREYVNNSVIMQTDPSHQRMLKLVYDVDCDNLSDLPLVIESYSIFINGSEVVQAIKPFINPGADDAYISELIYEEDRTKSIDSEYSAIRISIILPEETDAEAVAIGIDDAIKKNALELNSRYPHSISRASDKVGYYYHRTNAERKTTTFNNIYNLENFIKNAEATITAEQRDAIDEIMSIKEETSNKEGATADDKALEKEKLEKPAVSVKHGSLGFILGILMYIALYAILLIVNRRVSSATNVEEITGTRLLGEVYYDSKPKGITKLFHSSMVNRLHYREKLDISAQINRIGESIDAICEHNGAKKLTVLNACYATEIVKNLKETISAKGIDISVVEVGEGFDEKNLLKVKNAVLIIGADTKISVLTHLLSLCSDYESNVFGSVYLSAC